MPPSLPTVLPGPRATHRRGGHWVWIEKEKTQPSRFELQMDRVDSLSPSQFVLKQTARTEHSSEECNRTQGLDNITSAMSRIQYEPSYKQMGKCTPANQSTEPTLNVMQVLATAGGQGPGGARLSK